MCLRVGVYGSTCTVLRPEKRIAFQMVSRCSKYTNIYIYIIPTYFEYFAHSEKKKKETCLYAARHTLVSYSPCNTYDIIFRKSVLSSRAPSPFFLPFLSFFLCLSVSLSPFLFLSSIILFSSSARSWLRPFSRSVIIH